MLFLSADIIAPLLTKLYNFSVEIETVISDWKLSEVIPIYKGKGSKDEAGNYRPIQFNSIMYSHNTVQYAYNICTSYNTMYK